MAHLLSEEARSIGFNQSVGVRGRMLHVQTEVLVRRGITIRTTIAEGGTVEVAEDQVLKPNTTHLEQLRTLAQEQHDRQVQKLMEAE